MRGLDKFKDYFAGDEQHYVLIGGAACDIVMGEAGLPFRATRDLDIVLCVEALDPSFGAKLWGFIEEGGYEQRQHSSGGKECYRFIKPSNDTFPFMLEFFARKPDAITLPADARLTPIPIGEEVASLSAILLDDAYYELLMANRRLVNGASVLDEAILIPFKARAYLDLVKRAEDGERVDSADIKKHRADVFRLLALLPGDRRIALSDTVASDFARFLEAVEADADFAPPDGQDRTQAIERLRQAYNL